MLISLFKLEDMGPALTNMVTNESLSLEREVIEKFEFSGAMTYSLVFQGTLSLDAISSELYGPFPFAFSSGFVQYAFSFIASDPDIRDKRMKQTTIGLLLMLVPEMVSKIDDFREELEKILIYKFRNIKKIAQVDDALLTEVVDEYNSIVAMLLNDTQANRLFSQIKEFVESQETRTKPLKDIALIFPPNKIAKIRNSFASLLISIPYSKVYFDEHEAYLTTPLFSFSFREYDKCDKEFLNSKNAVVFLVNVMDGEFSPVYNTLELIETNPKIGVIVSLSEDLEQASQKYGEFFEGLQSYIQDSAFFSSSYYTTNEFKAKLMEALFWSLIPIEEEDV